MFYVYLYVDPRNQQPFYVGKGTGDRMYSHLEETLNTTINKRKYHKIQSIRQSGLDPIIEKVKEFEIEDEAYSYEKELILQYGRKGYDDNGILTNITLDSNPPNRKGCKLSDNQVKAMRGRKMPDHVREMMIGRTPWNKGMQCGPLNEETKEKIRQANLGKIVSEETKEKIRQANLGNTKSEETRKKMSANMKGRIPWNKGKTGVQKSYKRQSCVLVSPGGKEYQFDSQCQACDELGLHPSKISNLLTGKIEHYHGWTGYKK